MKTSVCRILLCGDHLTKVTIDRDASNGDAWEDLVCALIDAIKM